MDPFGEDRDHGPCTSQPRLNLNLVLDQVAKDKGIERGVLIATLEDAMKTAAKKHFGQDRNLEAKYDPDKGVVELFQAIVVVDEITDPVQAVNQILLGEARKKGMEVEAGDELVFQIFYRDEDAAEAKAQDDQYGDILRLKTFRRGFGRIAAQTAKQVILQRTRDAERENVFNEYKDRKNEIVTGIARRFERGNIIVDLGRAEAVLPVREQVPRETYRPGDRVQAYVLDVLRESKGPQIVLCRASVNLLTKLFEMEVPEIAEGIVVIEAAAREPGGRAKIAVSSRDSDVDPVGACVGMKGSRVQAVVQELRGEKIDIVPYDEDPGPLRVRRPGPRRGQPRHHRRGQPRHGAHRPGRPAVAGHRPSRPERAPGGPADRLEAGHQQREPRARDARVRQPLAGRAAGRQRDAHRDALRARLPPGPGRGRGEPGGAGADSRPRPRPHPRHAGGGPQAAWWRTQPELSRMDHEREQARLAEARRHPDELNQSERMARVRGVGEKTIERFSPAGYKHGRGHRQREGPARSWATCRAWASRRPASSRARPRTTWWRRPSSARS